MTIKCPKCHFENPDNARFCGNCTTSLPSPEEISVSRTKTLETPMELLRGTTFADRYEIIEELGTGGMGMVYRVFDKKIKEDVALKLLRPEIASDKRTIERFSNELRLTRKIRHKNVCQMFDLHEEEKTHYITMEYVQGEDLKIFIRRAKYLPAGTAVSIAKQICEGLAEAHKLGVVHRDLKPRNIMIDKEGNAKIMDFGIARSLETKGITGTGAMIGTPEYMSPEQVEGKEADHRSDIYSLGVILYEMVTGRVPFEGDTPFTIGVKHKSEIPKDPKELNTQIPEDLNSVIMRCLEKDKEKRYQSAGEVRSELENIEKGIPATERVVSKRKPLSMKEITVKFSVKKLFFPALVVGTLAAIVVLVILRPFPPKEAVLIPSEKPSLAVMYFENNTGDENLDHWRKGLAELLIYDLSQSKYLTVLSADKLYNILEKLNLLEEKRYSSEDLEEVAAQGGAAHIVQGDYTKAGDIFRINVMLQETRTGKLRGSERVEGKEENFFLMGDELTKKIKVHLEITKEQIASDIDKEVGKIITNSPEAYKYYIEGRRYYNEGDYRLSIQFLERAVAHDSEFAMAYSAMAKAYANVGNQAKWKEYIQKALELTDRVPDKERYHILGLFYRQTEKTYDKAIEAYEKLLRLYPDDDSANFNLGALYLYIEEWNKARERFEVNWENKVKTFFTYINLARAYMAEGLYDKAKEVLEYYLNNFGDNPVVHFYLADNYLCQGKYDIAHREVDKAFSLNPSLYRNFAIKGDIYHAEGKLIKAQEEYQKLLDRKEQIYHLFGIESIGALYVSQGKFDNSIVHAEQGVKLAKKLGDKDWELGFHADLAYRYLKSGNPEDAMKECDEAWSLAVEVESPSWQRRVLFYRGLTYLELQSMEEAQRTADELEELIKKGMNRKEKRYYQHLMGMIELKRDKFSKAIEYFKKATSILPSQYPWIPRNDHAVFFESLAFASYRTGDLKRASKEYERVTSLTTGRLNYGDIYAKSFYMLGKIFEQKGWEGKAIESYEKFLSLWNDADPGIAEVDDARKRLADLQAAVSPQGRLQVG